MEANSDDEYERLEAEGIEGDIVQEDDVEEAMLCPGLGDSVEEELLPDCTK